MMAFTFKPLALSDLPMMAEWLRRPHVAQWWNDRTSLEQLREDYAPVIAGTAEHACYIVHLDGEPFGFIQYYVPALTHDDGYWLDENDLGVRGIDQFIANESRLNQGLGTAMISAFIRELFADPSVTRIQTDPDPRNGRAIRCYEKAGFYPVGVVETPDGTSLLMYRDRTAAD